jgi:hypothetical protein
MDAWTFIDLNLPGRLQVKATKAFDYTHRIAIRKGQIFTNQGG